MDASGHLPNVHDVFWQGELGMWLWKRYKEATRYDPSRERIQLMGDALGADVLVLVDDIIFERNLADAAEYKRLVGSLPTKHGDDPLLAKWILNRRKQVNHGSLSRARAQRLDTVLGEEWRLRECMNGKV